MIAVIDTQAGNLFNINKIVNGEITRDPYVIERADKIVFPGVGSFSFVMDSIEGIKETIIEKIKSGIPYLGICLGLEVLYDSSEEGPGSGLSILSGSIKKLTKNRVPHIGWDTVELIKDSRLFSGIKNGSYFYFLHSYYAERNDYTVAITDYGNIISSAMQKDNIYAVQFHPEKSGINGIKVLKNFRDLI
ncbi:imidazole glycerol phosphate synthase subunit HisH [Acidiplasma sp.]|uniref:imidazole glycerol phosphate synthase subunit HisH n=1 Tax=Acidiplasma sp. TaxID=1872114 RepID=UPI00258980BB|nr:imidazole glycerol phosphate synthase subunit HisH [Acidiplasma sp.]